MIKPAKPARRRARVNPDRNRPAAARVSPPPASPPVRPAARYTIVLRFRVDAALREESFEIDDRTLYPEAKRWNYVLSNRERMSDSDRAASSARALTRLAEIFGGDDAAQSAARLHGLIADLARASLVEVSLPFSPGDSPGYAARIFPWEMVITYLTAERRAQRLTVVRHLHTPAPSAWPQRELQTLLAVSNAPGKIAKEFNLEGECRLVAGILGLAPAGPEPVTKNPTAAELQSLVTSRRPDIIHLAGIDPHYAEYYGYIGAPAVERSSGRDGLVLHHATQTYDPADPERLAQLCTAGSHEPAFVAISTCFSGRRIAPHIVAAGAHAAVGFQDTITDADAEAFFSAFYRHWRAREWEHPANILLDAFTDVSANPLINLTGGVVLWSRHSVFTPTAPTGPTPRKNKRSASAARQEAPADPRRDLEVVFKTFDTLNYSLLHNRGSLFKEFRVRKQPGTFPDLSVHVALDAGGNSLPCRFTCRLPENGESVDLLRQVSTPLLAPVLRQVSECLRSHLYLRVSCEHEGREVVLRETTCPVTILPVDEWRDDGKDHCWLPSFVLPRDPAVLKITTVAQRYLRAIADDPQAGFSGYQGIVNPETDAEEVLGPQIRALWAALQHDFRLTYINPPPSYTLQAQRLRTPSQILAGGAATCIDLALLFSACLEYIGVYPAIFLIQGHAFPGYWRDDASWRGLQEVIAESEDVIADDDSPVPPSAAPTSVGSGGPGQKWMLSGPEHFAAVSSYVRSGKLVPFESTFVTAGRGFRDAREQGRDNLDIRTFDTLIDAGLARLRGGVTPLPILES